MTSHNDDDVPNSKCNVTLPARFIRAAEQHYQRTRGNSLREKSAKKQRNSSSQSSSSSSSQSQNNLSLSLNIHEKYDPQPFEETLRKTFNSKFDEELHKIKERTAAMLRSGIYAQRYHEEFEERRANDMATFQKRIPKLAIIHRIERVHRAKCPSFNIESCLAKKSIPNLPENATRQEIRIRQEKKIDAHIARMSNLEKQQSILKQSLTPDSKNKLGLQPIILPNSIFQQLTDQELEDADSEYYDHDHDRQLLTQSQLYLQTNQLQSSQQPQFQLKVQDFTPTVASAVRSPLNIQIIQEQPTKPQSREKPENRHMHPCNSSFHDDDFIDRQFGRTTRSFSTTSASLSFANHTSNPAVWKRQQAMINHGSTPQRNNFMLNQSSFDQRRRTDSSFYQASPFHGSHSLSQTKIEIDSSFDYQQKKSSPAGVRPSEMSSSSATGTAMTASPTLLNDRSSSPQSRSQYKQKLNQVKLDIKRSLRKCSPLNFLFNKYSQIIQEGASSNRQMKSLKAIYITNPDQSSPAKKRPSRSNVGIPSESQTNFYSNAKPKHQEQSSNTRTDSSSPKKSKQQQQLQQLSQLQQPTQQKTTEDISNKSKDLIRTLLEFKKEQVELKQQAKRKNEGQKPVNTSLNSSPQTTGIPGKRSKPNHGNIDEQISPYDNLQGQYNVSDFLKKITENKEHSEKERIALRNASRQAASTESSSIVTKITI